jgi:hypothetical protein
MIELLKIHAMIRIARVLIFVGNDADGFGKACLDKATKLADDLTA